MLYHEWMEAAKAACKEEGVEPASDRTLGELYNLARTLYTKRKLDAVCYGPDRHKALALWMLDHKRLCWRYQRAFNRRKRIRISELRRAINEAQDRITHVEMTLL